MSDPMDDYVSKNQVFESAKSHAEAIVARIQKGASALKNWRRTIMANISFGAPFMGNSTTPTIDGPSWPSGQQLADALTAYHKALGEAQSAYNRIPATIKASVKPPVP